MRFDPRCQNNSLELNWDSSFKLHLLELKRQKNGLRLIRGSRCWFRGRLNRDPGYGTAGADRANAKH